MSRIKPLILTVVWGIVLVLNGALGSEVTLTASSPAIQPLLTPTLSLRCSLEDTSSSSSVVGRSLSATPTNVNFVSAMFLFKDNEDIATVSEHFQAHAVSNALNLNISGAIPGGKPGEKGFLEVSMSYPTESQGGNYTCRISAVDDVGHPVVLSKSVGVDVTAPTINDMVHYIMIQDQNNKAKIASLESQNILLEQTLCQKIHHLEDELNVTKHVVNHLEDQINVTKHVEGGIVSCGGNLGSGTQLSRSTAVTFTSPYRHAPLVHVAVHDAGIYKDYHANFHVTLVKVDAQGFTVECKVPNSGHYLSYLQLSWLSFPV